MRLLIEAIQIFRGIVIRLVDAAGIEEAYQWRRLGRE
jgi:hypothetical protein